MACPNCYKKEDFNKLCNRYVCSPCNDIISKEMGIENIEDKYKMKGKASSKEHVPSSLDSTKVTLSLSESEDEEEEEDEDDDDGMLANEKDEDAEKLMFARKLLEARGMNVTKANKKVEPKNELCRHYKNGRCNHGFSGNKPFNNVEKCAYMHPKVCEKLFKFGFHKTKGCKGKASGCNDFHPNICKDLLNGTCSGNECSKGFHFLA